MTSIGSGFDLSAATYSSEGKIHQVEYAMKNIETANVALGVKCKNGVVLAVQKRVPTKLLVAGTEKGIWAADSHIGTAFSGFYMDGIGLSSYARKEALGFKKKMDMPIPGKIFTEQLSLYVHAHTLYSSVRPFGVSMIIGVYEENTPQLYMVEPSGQFYEYKACCAGKEAQTVKTELGKRDWLALDCINAVSEIAKIMQTVHSSEADATFELEMSWLGPQSDFKHRHISLDIIKAAEEKAEAEIRRGMELD